MCNIYSIQGLCTVYYKHVSMSFQFVQISGLKIESEQKQIVLFNLVVCMIRIVPMSSIP